GDGAGGGRPCTGVKKEITGRGISRSPAAFEQVRVDTVAVLCCSWHGQVLRRLYRTRPVRYHGRDLVALPDEARQRSTVPILLVWDNLSWHRSHTDPGGGLVLPKIGRASWRARVAVEGGGV